MANKTFQLHYPYVVGGGLFPRTLVLRTWKDTQTLAPMDIPTDNADAAIWIAVCSTLNARIKTLTNAVSYRAKNFIFGATRDDAKAKIARLESLAKRLRVGGLEVKNRAEFLSDLLQAFRECSQHAVPKGKAVPESYTTTEQIILSAFQNTPEKV